MGQSPSVVEAYVRAEDALSAAANGTDTAAFAAAEIHWAHATIAYCDDIVQSGGFPPIGLRDRAEDVLRRPVAKLHALNAELAERDGMGHVVAYRIYDDDGAPAMDLLWELPDLAPREIWPLEVIDELSNLARLRMRPVVTYVYCTFAVASETQLRVDQEQWTRVAA